MSALSWWRRLRGSMSNGAAVVWRALVKYHETDGEQRAASFAYYAFFALFPLIVLLITLSTSLMSLSQEVAAQKISAQLSEYLPRDPVLLEQFDSTLRGFLKARNPAGFIAFGVLAWSALRIFQSLVHGVNRAWGTKEYPWWHWPIKNLIMVGILASALLVGVVLPMVLDQLQRLHGDFIQHVFALFRYAVPLLVLFYGLCMFYKFAPQRRTLLGEVWQGAAFSTLSLHLLQWAFIFYTQQVAHFNAVYGFFGSALALLMWIYLSGSIIILGGCICAATHEIRLRMSDQARPNVRSE